MSRVNVYLLTLVNAPAGEEVFYAPWRDDPRPALGLLHGAYAHMGIAQFWLRQMRSEVSISPAAQQMAAVQFARWRTAAHEVTELLRSTGLLTQAGSAFTAGMQAELLKLIAEPVDPAAVRSANVLADEHRRGWRQKHGLAGAPSGSANDCA